MDWHEALRDYAVYVVFHHMVISKIDPLKYISEKLYLSSQIVRWQVLLLKYDIIYMTRNAIKGSVITDHLADNVIKEFEPLNFDFPYEDV